VEKLALHNKENKMQAGLAFAHLLSQR